MKRAPYVISLVIILFVLFNHFKNSYNKDAYNIKDFSNLPVQQNGRLQPIDTVARNSLLILSGRQYAVTPENDKITAIEWFIISAMKPEIGDEIRVFKIEFPDELGLSGLSEISKRYYSFNDLKPYFNEIDNLYNNIEKEDQKRNAYERQINELYKNLVLYKHYIQLVTRLD